MAVGWITDEQIIISPPDMGVGSVGLLSPWIFKHGTNIVDRG